MSLEQKINYQLNKYPAVKKVIKRVYQIGMYAISKKIKSEGNITRVSPDDEDHEYFFGYYDKSPWDITDRYMLCLKANDTWSDVSPKEAAQIILIDTEQNNRITILSETHSWNVQQGCMLQWLGPNYRDRVIFNDYREGKYCSVILKLDFSGEDVNVAEEKVISAPVYTVAADGTFALTLDFSRLYRLRPGYGYYNVPEKTANEKLPDKPCIWYVDLISGSIKPILKYTDFANFNPRPEMKGAEHKVNHIMLCPNGKRFMVLHRWFLGGRKYTRLVTCNVDGTDMYVLSDDDMVSHCYWKNDKQIFAFENKKEGQKGDKAGSGYYLMKDKTQEYRRFWTEIDYDGHPSYSPDGSRVVFDCYPNRARVASVMVSDAKNRNNSGVKTVARVFAPFKYDNDTRCDLHPRWNRAGSKICFDSVFEGHRGLYVVSVPLDEKRDDSRQIMGKNYEEIKQCTLNSQPCISVIVPVYNVESYLYRCVRSIINQTYENLEIILINDGSTDKSGKLCEEIAQTDERIKVVHKKNGGLSSARNTGLDIATGEYVAFVDSDDWISNNIYKRCIETFENYQCDIVDFKVTFTDGKSKTKEHKDKHIAQDINVNGNEILYDYLYRGQTEKCPFSVWRKVYKRILFAGIRFPEGKVNEDIATNFKILMKTNCLVHISDIGYFYFQGNNGSITAGKLRKKDFDLIDASKELCFLSQPMANRRIKELAEVKLARSYFSLLARAATKGVSDDIKQEDINYLQSNLRKRYGLLMKSPIPFNRKLLISIISIDYRCLALPYLVLRRCVKEIKNNVQIYIHSRK